MQRNKGRDALTILLVPHSGRVPVSLRLPYWLVWLISLALAGVVVAAGVGGYHYYEMQRRMSDLLNEQTVERVRQREMRATILSQQDQVRSLSTQVEGFKAELLSVRRLGDEIRDILGVPRPVPIATPTPTSAPMSQPGAPQSMDWMGATVAPVGGRVAVQPSSRSMRVAVERGHEVASMRSAVPTEVQSLQELRDLVVDRLARIERGEHGDWETLQRELRQWAAAPHLWPVYPRSISSGFGYRELRGVVGFHYGVDFSVWYGTEVRATKDGVVSQAGWNGGLGLTVKIEHEAGYSTLYAHNSRLLVKVGDKVKARDVIALSGSSGNSTGPHLHYEIHLHGTPVDPLRYISE